MKKEFLEKQKKILEQKGKEIEKELNSFAEKSEEDKSDWKSKFPDFGGSEIAGSRMETAQDEIEEYLSRLPVERSLENNLKDIKIALEKIKRGRYGKCENCQRPISKKRLEAYPEARYCLKCKP
jgi:DnaK suppressor protein